MKKLAAALLVVLVAGCSSLGLTTASGTSGSSGAYSFSGMGGSASTNTMKNDFIDPRTGQLTLYHGG